MLHSLKLKRILSLFLCLLLLLSLTACTEDEIATATDLAGTIAETVLTDSENSASYADEAEIPDAAPAEADAPNEADSAIAETAADEAEAIPEDVTPEAAPDAVSDTVENDTTEDATLLDPDASYTTKEDVALYIYQYGCLPSNFITKKEAQALGWSGGSLEPYAPGKCIGGTYFGNYEGNLPSKDGRAYTECDIDTLGANSRGAKRIVFSNDGLIYYTEDHYETFELLYGDPDA